MMRSRAPLRRRLIVGVVVLLAAVTALIGILSVVALRGFLVGRLDAQLTAAVDRSQGALDADGSAGGNGDGHRDRPPGDLLAVPGQRTGTVVGIVSGGTLTAAAVLGENGASTQVDADRIPVLGRAMAAGAPTTLDLGSGLGSYRVAAQVGPNGDGLVLGLPLAEVDTTVTQLTLIIAAIGLLGVALAAVAGAIVVRLALRPLERVAVVAGQVAELPLDRGEVALAMRVRAEDADPATEVGRVGAAFNRMIGHVSSALTARESSEAALRTFVADASHELRTPLASIRGYAELTRRGGHELPDDVVHSLGRIESESIRMTDLVEELLLLARLDEAGRPELRDVDLARLVIDAVGDAAAAGPDHLWALDVPDESVTVRGDAGQLHRLVANLLSNARVHTPIDTTVTTTLHASDSTARLMVSDTGPGIPKAVLPTIFQRFARGDSSRSRLAGSTGLGLAIVEAIASAHGGTVDAATSPAGAVFTVTLPLGPASSPEVAARPALA